MRRPQGQPTPCDAPCPKIPPGSELRAESAVELSDRNRRCLQHFLECEAVNWQTPDAADPLVAYHASVVRAARERAERGRQGQAAASLVPLLRLGLMERGGRGRP
jgi:hypothetical protein